MNVHHISPEQHWEIIESVKREINEKHLNLRNQEARNLGYIDAEQMRRAENARTITALNDMVITC